jgi:hypothetical protein
VSLGIGFRSNGTISDGIAQSRVGSSVTVLHFGHIFTSSLIWRIVRPQAGPLQQRAGKCVQRGTFLPYSPDVNPNEQNWLHRGPAAWC